MTKVNAILTIAAVMATTSPLARGAIIFADADHSTNTARADGSGTVFHTNNIAVNLASATDNLWNRRPSLGNGLNGAIYESNGATGATVPDEDAPRLVTTIGGLQIGKQYNIYAYFQSNVAMTDTDWRLRAGLENTVGDLPLFSRKGEGGATAGTLVTAENAPAGVTFSFANGDRRLYHAYLGATIADSNGDIRVYIDDFANPGSANFRSWYDGVGHELVPEPTALTLATLGLFSLTWRKRCVRRGIRS